MLLYSVFVCWGEFSDLSTSIQLDKSEIREQLDKILDDPVAMALVNASGWSATKTIDMVTKNQLVQGLILHETVIKREKQLAAFRARLKKVGFLKLLQRNPQLKELLIYNPDTKLTTSDVISLLDCDHRVKDSKAFKLFLEYLENRPSHGMDKGMQ